MKEKLKIQRCGGCGDVLNMSAEELNKFTDEEINNRTEIVDCGTD